MVALPSSTEPSHQNSNLVTPTSSVAVPVKLVMPLIVAPLAGAVRLAVGGLSAVAADCVTVKLCPAMVSVPVRELVAVLTATE